ncbi:hypothetical protein Pres01_04050 [Metapseudomonas resinovorans]|uniref:hypothetical protein n=1 Tax=Metapseudomonas resinovorans TaxID=53412 RepID=UPI00098545E3|nr:hypothetical protein [Pseudomonas resinovorans]GLZ84354.1 hypothetical protein Pres01_04050 [Pseudomonas resinovorans]
MGAKDPDANEFNRFVRQLRAMSFAHTLAHAARVHHHGQALATGLVQLGFVEAEEWGHRCEAWFRGALPNESLRKRLVKIFPHLQALLSAPLWLSLSDINAGPPFWDTCAAALRFNYGKLPFFSHSRADRLCSCPSLERMGELMILMRSRDLYFDAYRLWLQKNFYSFFCVACMQPSLHWVRDQLLYAVDELQACNLLSEGALRNWPTRIEEFDRDMSDRFEVLDSLTERGWIESREDDSYLLVSLLFDYPDVANALVYSDKKFVIPAKIRMRWRRDIEKRNSTTLEIAWPAVFSELRLDDHDRRVVRRLGLLD